MEEEEEKEEEEEVEQKKAKEKGKDSWQAGKLEGKMIVIMQSLDCSRSCISKSYRLIADQERERVACHAWPVPSSFEYLYLLSASCQPAGLPACLPTHTVPSFIPSLTHSFINVATHSVVDPFD
mmetsp:Transcript_40701/g.80207  ORF Transcript_40701/g.80207 Transcript_40701/m.80207 type:complete len:124 (+) Transcript_40701:341-712(+)